MSKKIHSICLIFLLCVLFVLSVSATSSTNYAYVDDRADLMTSQDEKYVLNTFDHVGSANGVKILFVSVQSTTQSIQSFASSIYASYGKGADAQGSAVVIVMDMSDRYLWIETYGRGYDVISDARRDQLMDIIIDGYNSDSLASALQSCATQIGEYFENEEAETTSGIFGNWLTSLLFSLVIGFVISLIVVLVMKSKLKSVRAKNNAEDYAEEQSFTLTLSREIFLYHTITRVPISQNNGSRQGGSRGHSSGGGRHF